MPRLTATRDMASAPRRAARPQNGALNGAVNVRANARARGAKPAALPDRPSARALFLRRVRRSLRPGLWGLGMVSVLFVCAELFRAIPAGLVDSPAGTLRHDLGALGAALGLRIADVEIRGADTTPAPLIAAALGVGKGDPILGFSLNNAQARIEALGPIQSAVVERALPGTVIVTVTERAAYAIWQTGGAEGLPKFVVIDKSGQIIANQDAVAAKRREPALLLLTGADAPRLAGVLMQELIAVPAVRSRVVAAERVDGLRWNLVLQNHTLVKLPEDDEARAIAELGRLQAEMALLDRPVEVIDLRMQGRLMIRPYPAPATPATGVKSPGDKTPGDKIPGDTTSAGHR